MSKSLRAIIIDDEEDSRRVLEIVLQKHCPDVEIVDQCQSGMDGLKSLKENDVEVVFLDVKMPIMNGFEFLEILPSREFEVVFVTAHDEFGIEAVKASACDYLLKPITASALKGAVSKVRARIQDRDTKNAPASTPTERLILPTTEGFQIVNPLQIEYIQAESEYCRLFMEDKSQILHSKKLGVMEEKLKGYAFCRAHKSYLVNLHQIEKFLKAQNGTLIMRSGKEIPVSRARKKVIIELFRNPGQWS